MTDSNGVACLLFHGFTGGPYEVEPLAEYLRGRGRICRVPELPGHDPELRGLRTVTWRDWSEAALAHGRAMEEDYGSFDLIGFSMGGLLAAGLSNQVRVRRLVLLSPALIPFSPGRFAVSLWEAARHGSWGRLRNAKAIPMRSVAEFLKLSGRAAGEWKRITQPTLIVQGGRDQVVHPSGARMLERIIPTIHDVMIVPGAQHLICTDARAGEVFERVERFLAEGDAGEWGRQP